MPTTAHTDRRLAIVATRPDLAIRDDDPADAPHSLRRLYCLLRDRCNGQRMQAFDIGAPIAADRIEYWLVGPAGGRRTILLVHVYGDSHGWQVYAPAVDPRSDVTIDGTLADLADRFAIR